MGDKAAKHNLFPCVQGTGSHQAEAYLISALGVVFQADVNRGCYSECASVNDWWVQMKWS